MNQSSWMSCHGTNILGISGLLLVPAKVRKPPGEAIRGPSRSSAALDSRHVEIIDRPRPRANGSNRPFSVIHLRILNGSSWPLSSHWRHIAKSLSRACARSGRGACRWSELLHHVIAREAGRLAVDSRRDIVALFLLEAWRFHFLSMQRDPGAGAT